MLQGLRFLPTGVPGAAAGNAHARPGGLSLKLQERLSFVSVSAFRFLTGVPGAAAGNADAQPGGPYHAARHHAAPLVRPLQHTFPLRIHGAVPLINSKSMPACLPAQAHALPLCELVACAKDCNCAHAASRQVLLQVLLQRHTFNTFNLLQAMSKGMAHCSCVITW